MELEFGQPWLVFAGVALLIGAALVGMKRRRISPVLFVLAGAAFFTAGARPGIGSTDPVVVHALVVDVSASMRSRDVAEFVKSIEETTLPPNHRFEFFELSDALRERGSVRGDGTSYARLGDLAADERVNGEILFVTDGRGNFEALYAGVTPGRLMLLVPPRALAPDASVVDLRAPPSAPAGGSIRVQATIACDVDADVPWRMLVDGSEAASGTRKLNGGSLAQFSYTLVDLQPGLRRITLHLGLPDDRESGNDDATVRVMVGGKIAIDYCVPANFAPQADALLQMLRAREAVDINVRHTLPATRGELDGGGIVIVNNLPNRGTAAELQVLAGWVRDGGALVMVGTDGAFGPGGYRNTPIESVMPVRFRPDDAPPRRTLLLLDVSQSMGDRLPGGETKLQRMQAAARRFKDALGEGDQAAVVGFREGLLGDIRFVSGNSDTLTSMVEALAPAGSTHIRSSLEAAVNATPEDSRIVMITDGEEVEGATEEMYRAIGESATGRKLRLDVVLTTPGDKPWLDALKSGGDGVHDWSVGSEGFDALIETLDRALAGADKEWVVTTPLNATGAGQPVPRMVRTALRDDLGVSAPVLVESPSRYPVVSQRALVGRTVAICTDSWGGQGSVDLWQDSGFRGVVEDSLAFVLENAGAVKLVLNPLDEGAELVWTGTGEPPARDLRTNSGPARLDMPGRWLLDKFPERETLRVFDGDTLVQRIPLPELVPAELRRTGNDEAFFAQAEGAGVRVMTGLGAWTPRHFGEAREQPADITWLAALVAMLLLIGGFATRRR